LIEQRFAAGDDTDSEERRLYGESSVAHA